MTEKKVPASRHWTLTYDHVDSKKLYNYPLPLTPAEKSQLVLDFRLKGDDKDLMFTGKMSMALYKSHMILDPLDFAMESFGCTEIWVRPAADKPFELI